MSTLKSINVVHPSSAVNNIVNDASGNVAVGNNLTVAGTATITGATTLTGNVAASGTLTIGGVAAVAVAPSTNGNVLTSNGTAWTSAAATAPAALSTASGSAPSYSARAWVNFNGTGTVAIRASGNVSSITDNGTGDYTMNFTTAMPDANYAACLGGTHLSAVAAKVNLRNMSVSPTTSAIRFLTCQLGSTQADMDYVDVSIFR
jgi:hypothetical protein